MKRACRWATLAVMLTALLIAFAPSIMAEGNGQGTGNSGTTINITVLPPSTGEGAEVTTVETSLDFEVSADNPVDARVVTLNVKVLLAVGNITIYAEIPNKNHMKIKWYNLLENGHFKIGKEGKTGTSGQGSTWTFGAVYNSGGHVNQTEKGQEMGIPLSVELDLTADGNVNPYNIPAGSTNGNATIIWTLIVEP